MGGGAMGVPLTHTKKKLRRGLRTELHVLIELYNNKIEA